MKGKKWISTYFSLTRSLFLALSVVFFSFCSVLSTSSPVNAIAPTLSLNVGLVQTSNSNPYWRLSPAGDGSDWTSWVKNQTLFQSQASGVYPFIQVRNSWRSTDYIGDYKKGDYFVLNWELRTSNQSSCVGMFAGRTVYTSNYERIVSNEETVKLDGLACIVSYQTIFRNEQADSSQYQLDFKPVFESTQFSGVNIYINDWAIYRRESQDVTVNVPTPEVNVEVNQDAVVNQIKQLESSNNRLNDSISSGFDVSHNDALNTQNAIKDAQNQAHEDSQAQTEAINNQSKQEQDQYDKDKQEESDRENDLNTVNSEISGLFSLNLLNPFAGIFALFSNGTDCASIPTVSQWLHAEDSRVCPWFPPFVRTTLTPILGIISVMILFRFVIYWSLEIKETV